MKVHPLLCSGPVVRAIIEGRQTQDRRPLKPQPPAGRDLVGLYAPGLTAVFSGLKDGGEDWAITLPYAVGDLLYVRETVQIYTMNIDGQDGPNSTDIQYLACDDDPWRTIPWRQNPKRKQSLLPATNMPRCASRLTLRVTEVRVERVQDISEADIAAEGIRADLPKSPALGRANMVPVTWNGGEDFTASAAFNRLWTTLYGPDAWERNDWVVAITFEPIMANIDDVIRGEA